MLKTVADVRAYLAKFDQNKRCVAMGYEHGVVEGGDASICLASDGGGHFRAGGNLCGGYEDNPVVIFSDDAGDKACPECFPPETYYMYMLVYETSEHGLYSSPEKAVRGCYAEELEENDGMVPNPWRYQKKYLEKYGEMLTVEQVVEVFVEGKSDYPSLLKIPVDDPTWSRDA